MTMLCEIHAAHASVKANRHVGFSVGGFIGVEGPGQLLAQPSVIAWAVAA